MQFVSGMLLSLPGAEAMQAHYLTVCHPRKCLMTSDLLGKNFLQIATSLLFQNKELIGKLL